MFRASLILASVLLASSAVAAPRTTTFAYDDGRLLRDGEQEGGLVHADRNDKGDLPLVVFLHGVNESGPLHRGLGGAFDVRPALDELRTNNGVAPFVLAGPSQTKEAWSGARMWSNFDLDAFVTAVSVQVPIDTSRVILAGHSGAGCNAKGGIYAPRGKIVPMAILALDTCMDAGFGKLLGDAAKTTAVHAFWQSSIWPRDVDAFRKAIEQASGSPASITKLAATGANPHESIAALALKTTLPTLLPPPVGEQDEEWP